LPSFCSFFLTGHPEKDFQKTVAAIKTLHETEPATQLMVSNQVIGEAYITLQHFYEISKLDARAAIRSLFASGHVHPLNGKEVVEVLKSKSGAGLMDRLIAQDYAAHDCLVLTNDRKMAKLPEVVLLK
jgi:predicted nucleic acid-binding protein